MNYKVYRLIFNGAVHFGKNSLENAEYTFSADTLFSALCQEALKQGEETLEEFYNSVKEGKLLFSDAFPYIKKTNTYFLPKPMKRIEAETQQGDSVIKKAYKNLKYIPTTSLAEYLEGHYDILNSINTDSLGRFDMKVSVSIRGEEETRPYRVGLYYFDDGNGLYIIVGYSDEKACALAGELLEALSYSGIGGKRSEGLGRFTLYEASIMPELASRLEGKGAQYMTLSVALPRNDELDASINGAQYMLCRRSGFIASDNYADEQMRKKDLYVFKSGSCFNTAFLGDVYDVSCGVGRHPVYRYAKPLFIAI